MHDKVLWAAAKPGPVENYQQFIEDVVKPHIEAVPGVALVNVNAGAPEELQIRFDPYRAAQLGIEIPAVAAVAGSANDTSGGYVEVGRRQYALRFACRYSPAQLGEQILSWPLRDADHRGEDARRPGAAVAGPGSSGTGTAGDARRSPPHRGGLESRHRG